NRLSFDVLHYEIGPAIVRCAAVINSCDVGMIQIREDVLLLMEAFDDVCGIHPAADHFDRNERCVVDGGISRGVNRPHSAVTDQSLDSIRADSPRRFAM